MTEANDVLEISAPVVEIRKFRRADISEADVVVFREGMAFPTGELISVVNTAHAVLVWRGENEYFYLRDDFVLSAREEEALVEWGIGRPLIGNSVLAVGGTLLVVFIEKVWGPAVVGTLLVATAGYRVQGVLTKVLRIRSPEWKSQHKLIHSRIHGTERVMQGVLVTLVALADLLDHRVLLLTAVILASVQVVLLECVGQARLTWGWKHYNSVLLAQLGVLTRVCVGLIAWLWLAYVFAWFFGCMVCGSVVIFVYLVVLACLGDSFRGEADTLLEGKWADVPMTLVFVGSVGVGIGAAVLGLDDADLKFSWQSLQPWEWPLTRAPDSFSTVVRTIGIWIGYGVGCFIVVYIVIGVFSFRLSSDGDMVKGLGERTSARKKKDSPGFSHYDKNPIPSRHRLVAGKDGNPDENPTPCRNQPVAGNDGNPIPSRNLLVAGAEQPAPVASIV